VATPFRDEHALVVEAVGSLRVAELRSKLAADFGLPSKSSDRKADLAARLTAAVTASMTAPAAAAAARLAWPEGLAPEGQAAATAAASGEGPSFALDAAWVAEAQRLLRHSAKGGSKGKWQGQQAAAGSKTGGSSQGGSSLGGALVLVRLVHGSARLAAAAGPAIAAALGAAVVQVVGRTVLLYRHLPTPEVQVEIEV
jgi:hypothetical protein